MVATIDVMVTSNGVMVTTIGGRLGRSRGGQPGRRERLPGDFRVHRRAERDDRVPDGAVREPVSVSVAVPPLLAGARVGSPARHELLVLRKRVRRLSGVFV
jgi:hypothetical protein